MDLAPYVNMIKDNIQQTIISKLIKIEGVSYGISYNVGYQCLIMITIKNGSTHYAYVYNDKIEFRKKKYAPHAFIDYINEKWAKSVIAQSKSVLTQKDVDKELKAFNEAMKFLENEAAVIQPRAQIFSTMLTFEIEHICIEVLRSLDDVTLLSIASLIGKRKSLSEKYFRVFRFFDGKRFHTIGHDGVRPSKFKKYFKKALNEFDK